MVLPDLLAGRDTQPRECDDTVLCVSRRLRPDARSDPFDDQTEPMVLAPGDEVHDAIVAEDLLGGERRESFRSMLRGGER